MVLPNNIKGATEVLRKDDSPLWGYFNNKEDDVCWIEIGCVQRYDLSDAVGRIMGDLGKRE